MIIKCTTCGRRADKLVPANFPRSQRFPVCRDCMPGRGTPLPRIGEGMMRALQLTWETEGANKLAIGRLVGGENSRAYGYRVIDRAVEADLIKAIKSGRGYALYPTTLGLSILGQSPLAA